MTIRAVIVDDEDLARRGIRILLSRAADVEIVGECSTAAEAVEMVRSKQPDLLFLDIQMSDKTGFDVIKSIHPDAAVRVVLVTAHDEFAVRAFDVHAFDYLVKPLDERRFGLTLERVRKSLSGAGADSAVSTTRRHSDDSPPPVDHTFRPPVDRIPVKSGGRVVVVRIADVDWIKAELDYISLFVGEKSWLVKDTISAVEDRFASAGFVRIHRSTLVNVDRVKELRRLDKGEYHVILTTGTVLKLSRNYRAALPRLIGSAD